MREIAKLDETSRACHNELIAAEKSGNHMAKGLILARSIVMLRNLVTKEIMSDVMQLQGTPLGFKTDKDRDGGYAEAEVREVLIQSLLRGLRPTGNEWNIIAGNLYVTKEGLERLLKEFPGLSGLKVQIGVPAKVGQADEGALVPARATWYMDGVHDGIECQKEGDTDYRIPIRVNKFMGVDAIQGKAISKLYRKIYQRITGSEIMSDADTDGMADSVTSSSVEIVTEELPNG